MIKTKNQWCPYIGGIVLRNKYKDVIEWLGMNEGRKIAGSRRSINHNRSSSFCIKSYKIKKSNVDCVIYGSNQSIVLSPYNIEKILLDQASGCYIILYSDGDVDTIGIVA